MFSSLFYCLFASFFIGLTLLFGVFLIPLFGDYKKVVIDFVKAILWEIEITHVP